MTTLGREGKGLAAFRSELIAGVLVAVVVAASVGAYVALTFPKESTEVLSPISVYSNRLLVIQSAYGPNQRSFGIPVWQATFRNNENTTLEVNIGLYRNGQPTLFNNTALKPGQVANVSECFITPSLNASFVARIFGSSASGVITPEYPVSIVNASIVPFSNQFNVSTHVSTPIYNSTYHVSFNRWSISVSNTGDRPIEYLFAELSNGAEPSALPFEWVQLRCAGSTLFAQFGPQYASYSLAVAPGQTASYVNYRQPSTGYSFSPGMPLTVNVLAVYSDGTEVIQSLVTQAGA